MPHVRPEGHVKSLWQAFVRAVRSVLDGLPEHRHQDQYLRVKEAALALAESPGVAEDVELGYRRAAVGANNEPLAGAGAAEVVVLELESFPLAVQVHGAEEKAGSAEPGARKRLRSAARTVLGSVTDVFKLTDLGKGAATVTREALELWDGG
jgi:hypothetical protein